MRKIEIFIFLIIGINSKIFLDNSNTKPKNIFDLVISKQLFHQIQKDSKNDIQMETLKNAIKFIKQIKTCKENNNKKECVKGIYHEVFNGIQIYSFHNENFFNDIEDLLNTKKYQKKLFYKFFDMKKNDYDIEEESEDKNYFTLGNSCPAGGIWSKILCRCLGICDDET